MNIRQCKDTIKKGKTLLTNTIANPRTMMVESLNAVITNGAMGGPRWTEDLARETVLQLYRLPFHLKCGKFCQKKTPIFFTIQITTTSKLHRRYMNFVNNILHLLFLCNLTIKSRSRALSYLRISLSSNRSRTLQ